MGASQSNYMLICNQQRLPLISFSAYFLFSLFGNLQDYYTNFSLLNRLPFVVACFQSITFLCTYCIRPCYLFEKTTKMMIRGCHLKRTERTVYVIMIAVN